MGYLPQLLLALVAVAIAEAGGAPGWTAPIAVAALAATPHVAGRLAHRSFLAGRFARGSRWIRALGATPTLAHAAAVLAFGWPTTVEEWTGLSTSVLDWPGPGLLLALAPYLVYQVLAIDANARLADTRAQGRRAWRGLQLRLLASTFVPIALYVGAAFVIGLDARARAYVEEVALWNACFAAVLIVSFALLLPTILRNTWETAPLPEGPDRRVLDHVAQRADFACRDLLVWRTGNLMANAAIVGLTPKSRIVLFSDSLLARLAPRELAAVFAHEMGHAVRHHVAVFLAWAVAFFLGADLLATWVAPDSEWIAGGIVLATLGSWAIGFGYASRRFELEADLYSLELLGDVEALISALEKVGGRFRDVASWRHFSTAKRVAFLERAVDDPDVGRKLRRTLRTAGWLGAGLLALTGALQLYTMGSALDEDLIWVDLRLGRYERAVARAEERGEVPEHLGRLLAQVVALGDRVDEPGVLEREAQAALERDEPDAAITLAELALLRGADELAPVVRAIRSAARGEPDEARRIVRAELTPAWRDLVESWIDTRADESP